MKKVYLGVMMSLTLVLAGCADIIDEFLAEDNEDVKSERVVSEVEGNLDVHFIDVGQGDAILMQTYGENGVNVLVDAGDWNKKEAVEYLDDLDIDTLDLVVGSHPHADHIGQLDKIISEYDVEEVWMSGDVATSQVFERVIDAIDESGASYVEPEAGDHYTVGDIEIDILSPAELKGDLNNGSIVMRVDYGEVSFLLTGDAEGKAEKDMLERGEDLEVDILKAGHHGSDTSSTEEFIQEVNPDVVVMQVGKDNKYSHPMQSVLDRFIDVGAEMYSTKDNGTVIIETDGVDYEVKVEKEGEVTSESD